MSHTTHAGSPRSTHSGVSLIIVLIFLAILSGLAITAMQGSGFAARIAGNEADRNLSFQAAEAALRDAEYDIRNAIADGTSCVATSPCRADLIYRGNGFDTDCPNGRCVPLAATATLQNWEVAANWNNASTKTVAYGSYTGAAALPVVSRQPRYMLEYFKQGDFAVYRITAIGFGANESTQTILQSAIKAKQT